MTTNRIAQKLSIISGVFNDIFHFFYNFSIYKISLVAVGHLNLLPQAAGDKKFGN